MKLQITGTNHDCRHTGDSTDIFGFQFRGPLRHILLIQDCGSHTNDNTHCFHASVNSDLPVGYDGRSFDQCVLVPSPIRNLLPNSVTVTHLRVSWFWVALCDGRQGPSCIIVAHPRQRSHSQVQAKHDSWSYFAASYSRLTDIQGWRQVFLSPRNKVAVKVSVLIGRLSVRKSIFVPETHLEPLRRFFISHIRVAASLWISGALSYERVGLVFTVGAGTRYRTLSQIRVHWVSGTNFIVSSFILSQSGRPTPHTYVPQEQRGPVKPPGTRLESRPPQAEGPRYLSQTGPERPVEEVILRHDRACCVRDSWSP